MAKKKKWLLLNEDPPRWVDSSSPEYQAALERIKPVGFKRPVPKKSYTAEELELIAAGRALSAALQKQPKKRKAV